MRFDQCTIRWAQSMSLGASVSNSDGAVRMEVDRVEKGKSGGKKGKSKDGGKGKDKGKGNRRATFGEKGNQTGKGYGSNFQSSSWQNRQGFSQQTGWSGKSDSSSKGAKSGKGSKGKDSGKNNDQTCHHMTCHSVAFGSSPSRFKQLVATLTRSGGECQLQV